jgi:hypothetical protein
VVIEQSNFVNDGSTTFYFGGGQNPGLVFRDVTFMDNAYGIKGDGTAEGLATLQTYAAGYVWERVTVQTPQPHLYGH